MKESTALQIEAMKKQSFGIEIEGNNITREKAAKTAAEYFGTGRYEYTARRNGYDSWSAWDAQGREWKFQKDVSIAGVFAIDPRTKEPIVLHKVQAIDMFDAESFREEIRLKKQQIAAATGAFRELTKGTQILIDSAKTRPFIEAEKLAAGLPSYAMPVAAGEDAPESSVNQILAPSEKIADKISREIKTRPDYQTVFTTFSTSFYSLLIFCSSSLISSCRIRIFSTC